MTYDDFALAFTYESIRCIISLLHVFIMSLLCVFIDKLNDDNIALVFTTVFIICDAPCMHHVSMACIHR